LLVKQPSHIKRGFDILAAGAGLVVLSPVLLVIAALVKLGSRGPVFFRQARLGLGGRPFQILKFRTMHVSEGAQPHQTHLRRIIRSNSSRVLQKLDHQDRRIIVGGRLLRALGLDELPQLFNVLRGDMSLVGPRPCMPYEAQEFESWQRGRFDVLPGITGLWQVSGKNHTSFKRMMRLDNTYARRPGSIGRDLLIILRTPLTVWSQVRDHFKARGA
jgi:lipopolysaccharide/colanic/teichoic acid biosynthesis glycosyltransferase